MNFTCILFSYIAVKSPSLKSRYRVESVSLYLVSLFMLDGFGSHFLLQFLHIRDSQLVSYYSNFLNIREFSGQVSTKFL